MDRGAWPAAVHGVTKSWMQPKWLSMHARMWDLSSPSRDRTLIPCIGRKILNHWTTREFPLLLLLLALLSSFWDLSP